jgi:hypothetical protein
MKDRWAGSSNDPNPDAGRKFQGTADYSEAAKRVQDYAYRFDR